MIPMRAMRRKGRRVRLRHRWEAMALRVSDRAETILRRLVLCRMGRHWRKFDTYPRMSCVYCGDPPPPVKG